MNLQDQLRDAISAAVSYCIRNDFAFGAYEGEIIKAVLDVLKKQEPVKHEFQGRDGTWHSFIDQRHYENTVADGTWPIRPLYALPGAKGEEK